MSTTHNGVGSRLFLSADVVGSVARKQAHGQATWFGEVLAFYQQFPTRLAREIKAGIERAGAETPGLVISPPPQLWKAEGDELIYSMPVTHEHQVCLVVDSWIAAMQMTENEVLKKMEIDLKGAAWIATFPDPDRTIAVPLDDSTSLFGGDSLYDPDIAPEDLNRKLLDPVTDGGAVRAMVDYLGPSLDIGFRLRELATPRRFVLSVETAWAIAAARTNSSFKVGPQMFFGGETELKNVWAGRGYPYFWLDTGKHPHGAQQFVDAMLGIRAAPPQAVRDLAEALRDGEEHQWPCRIYLPDSGNGEFTRDKDALDLASSLLAEIIDTSGEEPTF